MGEINAMHVYKLGQDLLMELKRFRQNLLSEAPDGETAKRRYENIILKHMAALKRAGDQD